MFSFPRAALDAQLEQKVDFMNTFGGFPLGTVPGTLLVPPRPGFHAIRTITKTWRVNSTDHWLAGENRHYASLNLWHETQQRPARFKSAQPAKDRTQLLFEQTHLFVSTKKIDTK